MAMGDNIRRLRTNLGMTQGELSLKSGVKLGQISKIERNEADPKASTLYKILTAMNCSADSIFLDQEKTGMKGILKEAFENAAKLPEDDQITIIKVIDKFCLAEGLNAMVREHRVLIDISRGPRENERPPLIK